MGGQQRKTLILHALRFDWLESGTGGGAERLYSGALFAFLISALVGGALVGMPAAVALPILFAVTAIVAFVGILSDVGGTILDPRDVSFLEGLPVSSSTYFQSRLCALALGLVHLTLGYGLIPALLYSTGGRGPWWAFLPFLTCTFLMMAVLAALAVAVFLWLQRFLDPARLRDVLVWVQVLLFVAGTTGWLLWFGAGREILTEQAAHGVGLSWLPSSWFAALFLFLTRGHASDPTACILAVSVPMLVALLLVPFASRYLDLLAELERPTGDRHPRGRSALRRLFQRQFVSVSERPGFDLGLALVRRERTLRLQTYPLLAYPILFLAFGRGHEDGWLFSLLFSHFALLALPLAALFLIYSDSSRAAWIFDAHGLVGRGALWQGTRKALVFGVVVPLYALVTLLLMSEQGVLAGLLNGGFALGLAVVVVMATRPVRDVPPFSEHFGGAIELGSAKDQVFLLMAVIVVLALLQKALWTLGALAMAGLTVLSLALAWRRLHRPHGRELAAGPIRVAALAESPALLEDVRAEPFPRRLTKEARALGALYAGGALLGLVLGFVL